MVIAGTIEVQDIAVSGAVAVAETLTAGAIETKTITANTLTALTASVDNLIISTGLVVPNIKTNIISPLADGSVKVDLSQNNGNLSIIGKDNKTVASIDNSGDVKANSVEANDVKAKNIYKDGVEVSDYIQKQVESSLNSNTSLDEIESLLKQAQVDKNLIEQNQNLVDSSDTASDMIFENLYVINSAAFNTLTVNSSITLGTDLVAQSTNINGRATNAIDSLTSPLKLQSLALAPLEIMAGKVQIDTNGNVIIAGNLAVAGNITSSTLNVTENNSEDMNNNANLLSLVNKEGLEVAGITATGAAQFTQIGTSKLIIADSGEIVGQLVDADIQTNAIAGTSTLPANKLELRIANPNVNANTLVYITPTSSTDNNVLYVKAKGAGYFVVGFNNEVTKDVEFNWWLIETQSINRDRSN